MASPRRRPRCCFLNLTFFGIIMMSFLLLAAWPFADVLTAAVLRLRALAISPL